MKINLKKTIAIILAALTIAAFTTGAASAASARPAATISAQSTKNSFKPKESDFNGYKYSGPFKLVPTKVWQNKNGKLGTMIKITNISGKSWNYAQIVNLRVKITAVLNNGKQVELANATSKKAINVVLNKGCSMTAKVYLPQKTVIDMRNVKRIDFKYNFG